MVKLGPPSHVNITNNSKRAKCKFIGRTKLVVLATVWKSSIESEYIEKWEFGKYLLSEVTVQYIFITARQETKP